MGGEEGGGAVEACSRVGAAEWGTGVVEWEMGAAGVKCCTSIHTQGEVDLECPTPEVAVI